tara:strand:- start:3764 stop:3883 length:120 start_codon:yes stop_codon:yes gene_type:complete
MTAMDFKIVVNLFSFFFLHKIGIPIRRRHFWCVEKWGGV